MCKSGYKKISDNLIVHMSCCSSDNCNTKLTPSEIQDIIQGNVPENGGGGVNKSSISVYFSLIITSLFLISV